MVEISGSVKALLIVLILGLIVVAIAPSLFTSLAGVNQTGWSTTEIALWAVVVIVFVVALIMIILRVVEEHN